MIYNVYFDYCALVNLFIIIVNFYIKKSISNEQNKYFKIVLWTAVFSTVFDLIQALGLNGMAVPKAIMILTSYGYFIAHNATPFFYLLYVISISNKRIKSFKRSLKITIFYPIIFSMLTVLSTPFTKAAFYLDQNGIYYRGKYQIILYVISFYYLIYGACYIISKKNKISKSNKAALCCFYVLGGGSVLLQFKYPYLLIENFMISVCFSLSFLSIQKPEEMLDVMSNVFNRSTFNNILKTNLENKEKLYVAVIHLNNLQVYQKALGVELVQDIIKMIARFLENKYREVYYLYEDTFSISLHAKDRKEVYDVVERIINRFSNPWYLNDMSILLKARACIFYCPEDVETMDAFYECMDIFINEKKENMENELILLAKDIDLNGKKRINAIEALVNKALKEKKFQVYYQPIYSVKEGKFLSAEALLRLWDEELGFIPPDEFICIAEKNGQILQIGAYVFESVCKFIKDNNLNNLGIRDIHINLSIIQCMQDDLANQLLGFMERSSILANTVKLEVTETAASSFPETLTRNMEILLSNGVHFALDDFGTGYSNFNSIASLPIDTIKLDKSLISETNENERSKIVLESSVAMIKKLNMSIIAEGVETEVQRDMLIELGCDNLQGYYFSKPINGKEFIEFLQRENFL